MDGTLLTNLAILVLAGFVGFAVISKVPKTLHTPLMSGTNAIHGIVLLGGIVVLGRIEDPSVLDQVILVVAIAFGMINVVGGFLVTDRMLGMFKSRSPRESGDEK
ncbi:MAG: NAD(P) transhydrogenase subunit alpha [Geodermatophilaceae bacterium]|nr:NAD(P) transhydrogenase subunit alpha [Geodermatophilaceae bacterium]MDQ3464108.1 NAD(P) transhydrogenase subunit alpha [Actinomycetota bacterium]